MTGKNDEKQPRDDSVPTSTGANDDTNLFDPSHLRLSQNFSETVGVKKALITVPVRKPNRQEFIRVHPNEEYHLKTAVLELKEERETYLVDPPLWSELPGELVPKVLFTTMNRQGVLTLWPVRLPGEDGRLDEWNASALEAAEMARNHWIRVAANMSLGAYEVYEATGDLPNPDWPEMEFSEILKVAFKGHYIAEIDHPVIRRLRGEL
ncbi:MAG: hypothetical protein ABW072_19025 [Sedimenticola sp.]